VLEQSDAAITLGVTVYPQHGWPFLLDTWVRYELTDDGLTATHGVINRSTARVPYATGAHPYLRVGDTPIADLTLTVLASSYFEVDEHSIPVAERAVVGTDYDLRSPRRVGELTLDTGFGQVENVDVTAERPRGDVAWLTAPNGARTTLWQDTSWRYLQVFTPRNFPRRALPTPRDPIDAIAIEPMSAPANALNSGAGLVWLDAEQSWHGSWGLRYAGPR
jgi:aldose 1-epimerase